MNIIFLYVCLIYWLFDSLLCRFLAASDSMALVVFSVLLVGGFYMFAEKD